MEKFLKLNNRKISFLFFFLILLAGFAVRLYRFSSPIADWHSWRQADTSAVSRTFVTKGFDFLHPQFEDISNVPSGLDNPQGYRFVEFPLYNALQAGGYMLFKHFTLEEWGRLVTIFMSLLSTLFIFLLGRKYIGSIGGLSAACFFAFVPYSIYYSRVILPDPSMVTATLGSIYFFDKFVSSEENKKWIWLVVSLLFTVSALLLKPYALFFLLPLVVLAWQKWKFKMVINIPLWIFLALAVIPLAWWRWWMTHYPAGIPVSDWLFNGGNIRFTGAYFYWIFADRLSRLILGFWGLPIFIMGFISKKKSLPFFLSFVLSSLLYLIVIARGNVQHDYYQILIIPTLAFLFGLGVDTLLSLSKEYSKIAIGAVIGISCLGMLVFGWYFVRDYFNINNPNIVVAGKAVDMLTPKNAKVIAPYDGDTSFLYQTNRQGWASFEKDLPVMIQMGANYLVLVNPTKSDLDGFGKQYKVVSATSAYLLVNLNQKQ